MNKYPEVAKYFEYAFDGTEPPAAFAGAIKAMKTKPELCAKIECFEEAVWSIIQDFLNAGGDVKDKDSFVYAVALLESQ